MNEHTTLFGLKFPDGTWLAKGGARTSIVVRVWANSYDRAEKVRELLDEKTARVARAPGQPFSSEEMQYALHLARLARRLGASNLRSFRVALAAMREECGPREWFVKDAMARGSAR